MKEKFIIPGQWHTVAPLHYGYEECSPGYTFGPATRDNYLLHFVFSGSGYFLKDKITHFLSAGDIFVIRPGEITTYYAAENDPWKYGWIGFSSQEELGFLSSPIIRNSEVHPIFQRFRTCCEMDCADIEIFSLLFKLLHILSQENKSISASNYAIYAKTQLDSTYMQNISICAIANALHINRRHLTMIFRKAYGLSPQEYLMQLRLEKAKEFLHSGYSVTDAASLSGFSDISNFSRRFSAYYGTPPSFFRRKS